MDEDDAPSNKPSPEAVSMEAPNRESVREAPKQKS
jgi:hypothetical protein